MNNGSYSMGDERWFSFSFYLPYNAANSAALGENFWWVTDSWNVLWSLHTSANASEPDFVTTRGLPDWHSYPKYAVLMMEGATQNSQIDYIPFLQLTDSAGNRFTGPQAASTLQGLE